MTRLLIVDDNEQNLYMLQILLGGHGYEVESAGDGAEALEIARRDRPDMIISDVLMPVMDGFTLCRQWKKDPQLQDIPFVFYTATYTDPKDEELALSLGAERFIVKPQEPDVFVGMLCEVLENYEAARLVAPREPVEEEVVFFKVYNEALIRKLEDKMLQLEEANRALESEIIERKRAEEEQRIERDNLSRIFEAMEDGAYIVDDEYDIQYVNPVLVNDFGPYEGHKCYAYFHDRDDVCPWCKNPDVFAGKTVRWEWYSFKNQRTYDLIDTPLLYADGTISKLGIFRDITERVQVEEERERLLAQVRAQAQQIEAVGNTIPEGVLLLDAKGQVILANPVAAGDLAILADAQAGDIITHLGGRPLAELLTSLPTKGLWHEVTADNRTFEIIARPMENGPEPENWVLVIRDVTQEREIQQRLQQQERLAAVGQLAAGIAHDFNNIMAIIVLYTQMGLRLPEIPAQLRDRLQIVDRQAKRATDLIQQILDFSRRAVLERRPIDLTPFLKEVVRLLERTVPESIKMEFTYGRDEYTVNADPTRMQQAIMNLVVNARDAMLPEGGGKLDIELDRIQVARHKEPPLPEMEAGEWVRMRVTDTGSGIPPDVLPHIFEPFYTTKEVGKGTGLGLAQVYGIVKQHEGHIDVSTEVGTGTTFTLYLPALLARRPAPAIDTRTVVPGQGQTIVVVEDNADLRKAMIATLEQLNYRVLEAADGRVALELLEQGENEIALVLSDLVMPEMGGQALFHTMKQRGLTLPMVMLTGHPMEKEMEGLREQGLAGWMFKPPNMAQLSQLLARALKT